MELNEAQLEALEDVGVYAVDVIDGRVVEGDDVIVVTSAGQKVKIVDGVATILMGPGYVAPEISEAPAVVEPETVPAVEDLLPIEPVDETAIEDGVEAPVTDVIITPVEGDEATGDGTGETLPPVDGDGDPTSDLEQSFEEMSVEQLKGLLRDKDLPVSGKKDELIDRLNAAN